MAVREFIGMRVVPIIGRIGEESFIWDGGAYEHLTIVMTEGGQTYMSRCEVPAGTPLTDTHYWAKFAEFNAQFALLQRIVEEYSGRITQAQSDASSALTQVDAAELVIADLQEILAGFTSESTVADAIQSIGQDVADVDAKIGTLPEGETDVVSYVDGEVQGINTDLDGIDARIDGINDTLVGFDTQNTVKTYVDTLVDTTADTTLKTLRQNLNQSEVIFDVAARHFRPSNYQGVQGFCVFKVAGVTYWAQGEINNDNDGQLNIYRVDNNTMVGSVTGRFGHIHGISAVGTKLYLDGTVAGTAPQYSCVDVTNPAAPVVLTTLATIPTVNNVYRVFFKSDDEVYMWSGTTGNIWVHSMSAGTDTLVCTLQDTDLTNVTVQDFSYVADENIFVFGTYHLSGVAIYDAATGVRINVIDIPTIIQHTEVQETEGACVLDGKLYVNYSEAIGVRRLTTLAYWDYASGTVTSKQEMRAAQSTNSRYLRVNISNSYDLVKPSGTNFRFASDAINLMRSQNEEFPLHIHIIGTQYDEPIFLQDAVTNIEADEAAVTLSEQIVINGGNCSLLDAAKFTFNNSVSEYATAISVFHGNLLISSVPTISGTFSAEITTNFNSILVVPANVTFTNVSLSRSVAFVKNATGINKTLSSLVFVEQ